MKRILRFLFLFFLSLIGIVALAGALFGYFIYSPAPELPRQSGTLTKGALEVGGLKRTYLTYVPQGLAAGAPLVLVMHGSGEDGAQIRIETGYGFERLADEHGFAVVYPDAYSSDWNDCGRIGDYTANGLEVDDVGFLVALADKLISEVGIDRSHVFATGVSAGGFMSLRLALEAPSRFRAVAAVAASVQTIDNFKCNPVGPGTSVMIMNGTRDPLVPFDGGEVNLLGLFYKSGNVRSARESAQYFADLNQLTDTPVKNETVATDGVTAEEVLWHGKSKAEVELLAIHGGGHGLPQPYYRRPRLLGPSPMAPDGPALIWEFLARQPR